MNTPSPSAAARWNTALAEWGIPAHIIDQAPASPWVHAPTMFRSGTDDAADTPSMELAREALLQPGSAHVLDVGCGGGRSSLPLAPAARLITGVDHQQRMLDQFAEAGAERGVEIRTVLGAWPDVADQCATADVVVCHHVVYNVGDIIAFVQALTDHATAMVVVELTAVHPQSSLSPMWLHFWNLERPTEPTADSFADVVRELGYEPTVEHWNRAARPAPISDADLVANIRQRLCLQAERDAEIAELLGRTPRLTADEVVTVAWRPR